MEKTRTRGRRSREGYVKSLIVRILDTEFKGIAKSSVLVKECAKLGHVSPRRIYDYLGELEKGLVAHRRMWIAPIAILGRRKGERGGENRVIYLPNQLVGSELIAFLIFFISLTAVGLAALLLGMPRVAIESAVNLLLLALTLFIARYLPYLYVKKYFSKYTS